MGTEILVILILGLLVLGPKRLHTLLRHAARAKAQFEEASRGLKAQLATELDAVVVPGGGVEPPRYQLPADFESAGTVSTDQPSVARSRRTVARLACRYRMEASVISGATVVADDQARHIDGLEIR